MKKIVAVIILMLSISDHSYSQAWKQYADSGTIYSSKKNTGKAIEFFDRALEELKKDSAYSATYAGICDSIGGFFYKMGKYKNAAPVLLEAKQIKETLFGKQDPGYASSCNTLGNLYRDMGEYEKAEPLLLESKQIRETLFGKKNSNYASSCNNLALLYVKTGKYEKAEPLYIEAKQIREQLLGRDHSDYASSCNNLAVLYFNMRLYQKAEPLYLEAKQIREKVFGKEHPDYANSCSNLGNMYKDMGQYEKAEPLLLEAKQIREKVFGKEHPDYANSCRNLGNLYSDMGQYEKAEPLYIEAKLLREKLLGKEHPDYAGSCRNLGQLYKLMGQYEKAEPLLLEAKKIWEKKLGKEHPDYARSCNSLANLYFDMGRYEQAEPLYLEATQIIEKLLGKEDIDYAGYSSNLAELYTAHEQYEKAEPLYLLAKQILEKKFGKEFPDYARTCVHLADLYSALEQYKKAESLYNEANQLMQKVLGKQHADYGASCEKFANLYWVMHQPLQAEKEFKTSFAVNEYNLKAAFQFTNEKEKAAYIKNISGEDDKAFSFYSTEKITAEEPYSLSLFHRNLILSASQDLQKQLFYANDTILISKYNEWTNLKKYLSVLYSQPINERKEDVAALEEKAGQLEKDLTRLSEGFKKQQQRAGWKDIQNRLQPDEASIEFVEFNYTNGNRYTDSIFYIALVLRKDRSTPSLVRLFEKKQLDSLLINTGNKTTNDGVTKLYASRGVITKGNNTAVSKSVYSLVWKPLEKELNGIRTVYFAPSGLLHRIAFAALPITKNEVLSDKYKLVQLTTTASVTDQTPIFITASDNLQFYGGINYDADSTALKQSVQLYANNIQKENSRSVPEDLTRSGTFNYLAGTDVEIKIIGEEAKKTQNHISLLSGINATEESFKALNGKASPAVIHIATHGFFFPDPKAEQKKDIQLTGEVFRQSDNPLFRSGLLFAGANSAWQGRPVEGIEDGILTAYEVSNMYLPNTKLAVLSACETALGDIQGSEGVYGLQRAFKIAGVQNLVMSLWKVPDAETAEFMQLFYKNMFAKQSISDAFYHAQTTMKNKYRNDPYKWAAWVLVR